MESDFGVKQPAGVPSGVIPLFMGAMWRKEAIPSIRQDWPLIARSGSITPWTTRKLGELIGLKS